MVGDILQPTHLLLILVVALLVLGPKRLPEVGRTLGKGLRDFRTALSGADPREDLAQFNQHAMEPVQMAEPPTTEQTPAPAPEPVATSSAGPSAEQYESD